MPITKPFDQFDDEYEQWFVDNRYVYFSEIAAVRHSMPKNGLGVEIGVGSGQFARPLKIPFGLEPSENMLKLAQTRGIVVVKAVAEHLPLKDDLFDFVLMVTTLCFLDDVNGSFQQAKSILKFGGKFINGFVDRNSPLGLVYQKKKQENVFYRFATFYSTEQVIHLLEQHEFKNIQTVQTVFGNLDKINSTQSFEGGHGKGGFVVVTAEK